MKRILCIVIAVLAFGFTYGQRAVSDVKMMPKQSHQIAKTPTDTIAPLTWGSATGYALYPAQGGGYVCGANGYGDLAKAQEFIVDVPYNIEGVMVWFGAKEVIATDGTVKITLWNMNGSTGNTTVGSSQTCPGTVLIGDAVLTANIDTSSQLANAHIHMFSATQWVSGNYAIGIDMSDLKNDSIGIISTVDGDASQAEMVWEQWDDGSWSTILSSWPLDFDMGVFPIVDISSGMVENGAFINGIKLQSYPNPATDLVTVSYEIAKVSNVRLEVFNMNGQIVKTIDAGQQTIGIHNMEINVSDLSRGTYVYSLVADGKRLTKRMIIE